MKKMHLILGKDLAERTGQNEIVCRGMLRLAIQDQCGFDDPALVERYLEKMGFREWETVLNNANLARRLANVGVKNGSEALAQLKRTLVEKQSLFTMSSL